MTFQDTFHVTWTTHKGDSYNPTRQVMESLTGTQVKAKAKWFTDNNVDYTIHYHHTTEGAARCVTS